MNLRRVRLATNQSESLGAGIKCVADCWLTITDSELVNNRVDGNGGALYQVGEGSIAIERSVLTGNEANLGAAGETTRLRLSSSVVMGNEAVNSSAGFFPCR